jgi:hypothetical protein
MKRTTGADETALEIASLVSVERKRAKAGAGVLKDGRKKLCKLLVTEIIMQPSQNLPLMQ